MSFKFTDIASPEYYAHMSGQLPPDFVKPCPNCEKRLCCLAQGRDYKRSKYFVNTVGDPVQREIVHCGWFSEEREYAYGIHSSAFMVNPKALKKITDAMDDIIERVINDKIELYKL